MKKFYLVILLGFFACNLFSAPLYRAGADSIRTEDFYRWEPTVAGVFSSANVADVRGDSGPKNSGGFGLRGIYNVRPWIGLGAEGVIFAEKSFALVDKYRAERLGAVIKFNLSPDTSPRVYLVLGTGVTRHRFSFGKTPATAHWSKRKADVPYVQVGLGAEIDIWKTWFAGAEINALYNTKTELPPYYRLEARWEKLLHLRTGVRF